jgi:hypothetical protein
MSGGGGGYSLDSNTAHSDALSYSAGGNAGISFGFKPKTEHIAIGAAALALVAVVWFKWGK